MTIDQLREIWASAKNQGTLESVPPAVAAFYEAVAELLYAIEGDKRRYERALRAIRDSKLAGADFGDWVQSVVEDVLDGQEAECPECGTVVHEGPCVGEEPAE